MTCLRDVNEKRRRIESTMFLASTSRANVYVNEYEVLNRSVTTKCGHVPNFMIERATSLSQGLKAWRSEGLFSARGDDFIQKVPSMFQMFVVEKFSLVKFGTY